MRLAFMEKDGFELELIELAGAAPFEAPDPGNPATRGGLLKVAFHSSAIDELYTSALEAGAKVQSSLRESSRTGGRFFILLDPDGNWVQIFG
jgi:predicted enzyme related to lactoylglutathione lyase